MTQYLGFPHYGDEYKLMGLAAYGNSSCRDEVRRLLSLHDDGSFKLDLKYFRHHKEDIAYEWHGGEPVCGPLFSNALVDALGPQRIPMSQSRIAIATSPSRHRPLTRTRSFTC